MKIIRYDSLTPTVRMDFHPDSALLLPGRVMFAPEDAEEWQVVPMVAVRLNRLGKCVAAKFASRYYDALALAVRIVPRHLTPDMEGELSGMDCSMTHGEWLAPADFLAIPSLELNGVKIKPGYTREDIDMAVNRASLLVTIKMGDIVMLPLVDAPAVPLVRRSRLKAVTGDGTEIMNVKVV